MIDPHVVALRYVLQTSDAVSFSPNPAPIDVETGQFLLHLEDSVAEFKFKVHFASTKEARQAIAEYLRAWEIDYALRYGHRDISFVYKDADMIDRNPPPPGSVHLSVEELLGAVASMPTPTISVTRNEYPQPPKDFAIDADVMTLWERYEGHLQGREPLLSMANYCESMIRTQAGSRRNAANRYRIDYDVLSMLGEICANRGDKKTARKVSRTSQPGPLTPKEERWIHEVIRGIIRHAGEIKANPSIPILTMNDLPKL